MIQAVTERRLVDSLKAALRAWLRADAESIHPSERERRLSEARRLTGLAVDKGLLKS